VVKIAGGAQFLDEQKIFNIGLRNLEALGRIFSTNGIAVAYSDVGGVVSRTMRLQLGMGKVSMHPLGKEAYLI
jgi:chemotaxis protein CheD